MSNFTRGKWEAHPNRVIVNGHVLALVNFGRDANVRLIAAAPEMYDELYEALQLCAGHSSYEGDDFDEQAKSIRELLARIDGEQVEA